MRIFKKIQRYFYMFSLKNKKNIDMKSRIKLVGIPIIDIRESSKLFLGDQVVLNSQNYGYHLNMHSPVKLMADGDNAEIIIGNETRINGACIHALKSIHIGDRCLIAANVQIIDSNGHQLSFDNIENRINTRGKPSSIVIEDDVWIGANAIILPGVRIGYGSVIGAGSVISKNIPAMSLVVGNPAQIVKKMKLL